MDTRKAVMEGLKKWRCNVWGEPLSLQQVLCAWATTDDYPSRSEIESGESNAAMFMEQIADGIVAQLATEQVVQPGSQDQ